ncbi:MAG TPA: hypothetical protein VHB70_04575 [Parafilimonas sp.]|nr:hypothetical protein [Parafilimonas sp.]
MRKFLLTALCLLVVLSCFCQPYKIGHREITWIDSSRDNRSVMFEIYYPAASDADNVPVVKDKGKKYPLVVFGHGYQLTYKDYLWFKDSLVPKGFFLVFPRTAEQTFPNHTDFAKDYAFLIEKFDATKTQKGAWYYNRIKNRYAVGGHSMGGGCSLLSVQYSSKITAVFNFAAAETNPSAIAACSNISIASLLFAGGKDCIAPTASNQTPMYNNIQNFCKTYGEITNARHCQWANNSSVCRAGEIFCSPLSASPKATLSATFSLLLPWLNDKLNLDNSEKERFQSLLTSTSGITYKQSCTSSTGFLKEQQNNTVVNLIKVFPSAIHPGQKLNIELPKLQFTAMLEIFNQSGGTIFKEDVTQFSKQTIQVSSANFQKGIYFVVVNVGSAQYKASFLIE